MKNRSNLIFKVSMLVLLVITIILIGTGCGKENKYVNVGVNMSTEGLSLYLTNTANKFKNVSTYVFFSGSSEESMEKLCLKKQGIDLTYLPVKDLGLIKKDDGLKVVFPDCFNTDGSLRGVWVAKNSWLESAPTYSARFITGLAISADYRASHMNVTYEKAMTDLKDVRDFDWDVYKECMEYCAAFAIANREELSSEEFIAYDAKTMLQMFEGFASGEGEGYELCKKAYDAWAGSDCESFEELFDFTVAIKALEEAVKTE